jgi:predicted exporter
VEGTRAGVERPGVQRQVDQAVLPRPAVAASMSANADPASHRALRDCQLANVPVPLAGEVVRPAAASWRAISLPIPVLAPVTSAIELSMVLMVPVAGARYPPPQRNCARCVT